MSNEKEEFLPEGEYPDVLPNQIAICVPPHYDDQDAIDRMWSKIGENMPRIAVAYWLGKKEFIYDEGRYGIAFKIDLKGFCEHHKFRGYIEPILTRLDKAASLFSDSK